MPTASQVDHNKHSPSPPPPQPKTKTQPNTRDHLNKYSLSLVPRALPVPEAMQAGNQHLEAVQSGVVLG